MDTVTRAKVYGQKMTARQRRRLVKKAGRDPYAIVYRDDGMGYPPSKQGFREVVDARHAPSCPGTPHRGHVANGDPCPLVEEPY